MFLSLGKAVCDELLAPKAKKLLLIECGLFSVIATMLFALMFTHNYTYHFQQVTLNLYKNGTTDFTTNVTSLVRALGTVVMFTLIFGAMTGGAVGLTCSSHTNPTKSTPSTYEEEMTKAGLVVISKTDDGTTYKLTELGRHFLRDYRFLEKTEEGEIATPCNSV